MYGGAATTIGNTIIPATVVTVLNTRPKKKLKKNCTAIKVVCVCASHEFGIYLYIRFCVCVHRNINTLGSIIEVESTQFPRPQNLFHFAHDFALK